MFAAEDDRLNYRDMQVGDFAGYRNSQINSEISPGIEAHWYAVRAIPGQIGVARGHLIGRRFGIWVPEITYSPFKGWDYKTKSEIVYRGDKLPKRQPMLPGYMFVFCWLDDRNYHRIKAIPGIEGFVCYANTMRPLIFKDEDVAKLRQIEALLCPHELPAEWRKAPRPRRRKRRFDPFDPLSYVAAKATEDEVEEKQVTAVRGWIHIGGGEWISTIDALRALDGRDENQSLAKSLGLAS